MHVIRNPMLIALSCTLTDLKIINISPTKVEAINTQDKRIPN